MTTSGQKRMRGRLDVLPEAVLVVAGGRILEANAEAERLLGATLRGRALEELLVPGRGARLLARLAAGASPDVRPLRVRLRAADGTERALEVRVAPLDEGCVLLAAHDVGESARAEKLVERLAHLPEDEEGALALLEASLPIFGELGWGLAVARVQEEEVELELLAPPPGSAPLMRFAEALRGRSLPLENVPGIAEAARTKRAYLVDDLPRRQRLGYVARGSIADELDRIGVVRGAFYPVWSSDGAPHVLVVVGPDLTDWDFVALELFADRLAGALRAESLRGELLRSERLAATGDVAAELAESVRRSLSVMQRLAGELEPGVPEGVGGDLLAILREETARLSRLADALAGFAGHDEPVLEVLAVRPAVDAAFATVRSMPAFAERALRLDVRAPSDLPPVRADAQLMRRALVNLLVNAFQHAPEDGPVRVEAAREGEAVRLRVRNDGPPIPPEAAGRVFEPFFTTRATGTGLGLAIVRRIVEDLGGRVDLDRDATDVSFSLWLPIATP